MPEPAGDLPGLASGCGSGLLQVPHGEEAKRRHLLTCYRTTLATVGFRYLLDFELIDKRGESLYLVFGTTTHVVSRR